MNKILYFISRLSILICAPLMTVSAQPSSEHLTASLFETVVTSNLPNNASKQVLQIERTLELIEQKFDVSIAYQSGIFNSEVTINRSLLEKANDAQTALSIICSRANLNFKKNDERFYILYKKEESLTTSIRPTIRQEPLVSGKVTDETGSPVAGVTVKLEDNSNTATTNNDGIYQIRISPNTKTLHFSYIGYKEVTISIDNREKIDIQLTPEQVALEEIVVNALGFRQEKDKLGSTSSVVKAASIKQSGETGIINGLAGKAAGVQINRSTGDPGAGSNIQIRGQSTITGSNQPLVIIDGIPMSNSTIGDTRSGVAQQSRLNDINPEDIESLQVLKGASAAGLWGSRAANGVIIITTKQGANDNKLHLEFSSNVSFDEINRLHPLQSAYGQGFDGIYNSSSQYSWGDLIANRPGGEDMVDEAGARFVAYDGKTFYPILTKNSREVYNKVREEAIFKTGIYYDNNIGISGGNEKSNFYLSLGRIDQTGIYAGVSDYVRNSVRFNSARQFNDVFRAKANAAYVKTSSNRIPKGDNSSGLYIGMLRSAPDFDSRYWKGDYFASPTSSAIPNRQRSYRNYLGSNANPGFNDPLWTINELTNLTEVERFIMSSEINAVTTPWLDFTLRGGIDTYNDRRVINDPVSSVANSGRGSYSEEFIKETELNMDALGRINTQITPDLTTTIILGFNINDRKRNRLGGQMNNFVIPDGPSNFNNSIAGDKSPTNSTSESRTARLYSTINLGYKEWVYLNLSGAAESGSTFGSTTNATFFYPAADLAYIFGNYDIFKGGILSFGKLRGSFGIVGIQPEPYGNVTPFVSASYSSWTTSLTGSAYGGAFVQSNTQGDPSLKPERKTEWELGADLRFFNNRLSLAYTYYQNKVKDLLLTVSTAGSTGYDDRYTNAGRLKNKGMEVEANYSILNKGDFTWDVYANWSQNKNEVVDLAGTNLIAFHGGALSTVAHIGHAISSFYGGMYQRTPDGQLDLTADGFPQLGTESGIIGDPNPDWRGGLGTNISYKKFQLHVLMETFQGGDFYEGSRAALLNFGTHADVGHTITLSQDLKNYNGTVVPAGTTVRGNILDFGAGPVLADQSFYSSIGSHQGQLAEQFVSDGSWTRIREISLTYNLNSPAFKTWSKLENVSLGFTARNPFLWTKIVGIDPETNVAGVSNARGVDYFNNPSTRSWIINLRITY